MASHFFNKAKQWIADGTIDLDTDDIRIALLMTNTTAAADNDTISYVGDLATLDEMDGANYARALLVNETIVLDDANDLAKLTADNVTFTSLGAGTRSVKGLLVFKFVLNDTDSPVICWNEFASPIAADGNNFNVNWPTNGVLYLN